MITTHTSPPGFRDGIEAAAKVARSYKTPSGIYHTLIQEGIAAAIRAIPTPGTLPTGWNSDMGEAPRGREVLLLDVSAGTSAFYSVGFRPPGNGGWQIEASSDYDFTPTHWMLLPPPPPGE